VSEYEFVSDVSLCTTEHVTASTATGDEVKTNFEPLSEPKFEP